MELADTHAHLDDERFAGDIDAVVQRARAAGVTTIIAVGTTAATSRRAVELARRLPQVRAAVGIHPNYCSGCGPGDWDAIVRLAAEPEVVAIGETGLDRFRNDSPWETQRESFARHAELAQSRRLPLVIHCRDAEAEVVAALEETAGSAEPLGVLHSFTGQAATAARLVELGCYISFAGQLTYSNRKFDQLREVARLVPIDRLLVETDSPYLAPEPHRGQRNEPAHVRLTADRLAALRGMDPADLARATSANARRLFRLVL